MDPATHVRRAPGRYGHRAACAAFALLLALAAPCAAYAAPAGTPPAFASLAELTGPRPNVFGQFGNAVALDGDVLVVGAPLGSDNAEVLPYGDAYVYRRSGDAAWQLEAHLVAPVAEFGEYFGAAVAVSGDRIAVGAPRADGGGRVYLFEHSAGAWNHVQTLSAGIAGFDLYGAAVALEGSRLVVGAPATSTGTAFYYTRGTSAFALQQTLTATPANGGDEFGSAVDLDGDRLLIGAQHYRDGLGNQIGAAFVFVHGGANWSQQAKLQRTADEGIEALFGAAVALSGGIALVGAPRSFTEVGGDPTETGNAHAFVESPPGTWTHEAALRPADAAGGDRIGHAVALFEDAALVGAPGAALAGDGDAGAVVEWRRSAPDWTARPALRAANAIVGASFGSALAMQRGIALVGQPQQNEPPSFDRAGRAFVHHYPYPTASTLLTASPASPVRVGEPVQVTASVTQSGQPVTRGTLLVEGYAFDATSPETSCSLGLGVPPADCQLAFPTGGAKTLLARYVGVPGYGSSQDPTPEFYTALITQTVAGTLTHLPVINAPSAPVAVSLEVTPVAPGGGPVTGTVEVTANTSGPVLDPRSCSYTLPAQTSCSVSLAMRGDYGINARFVGNTSYGSSNTVSVFHRVNRLPQPAPNGYFMLEDGSLTIGDAYGSASPGNPNDDGPLANDLEPDGDLGQVLTVQAPQLVTAGGIGGDLAMNADGSFGFDPPADAFGDATLDFSITDGVEAVPFSMQIGVTPVNDAPVIQIVGDRSHGAGQSGQSFSVPGFATLLSLGPGEGSQSLLEYQVNLLRMTDGVANCCTLDTAGTLGYTLAFVPGIAEYSVTARDSGGTALGGQDTSVPHRFRILVGPIPAQVSISKSNGTTRVQQHQPTTYTIVVSNAGPEALIGVPVQDTLPAGLRDATWTCTAGAGAACPGSGTGDIATTVDLPAASQVTFTLTAIVDAPEASTLTNVASVTLAPAIADSNAADDSATDVDVVFLFEDGFE